MRFLIVTPTGDDARHGKLMLMVARDRSAIARATKKYEGRFTAPVEGFLRAEAIAGDEFRLVFYTQLWSRGEFGRQLRKLGKRPRAFPPLMKARLAPLSHALIRRVERSERTRRAPLRRARTQIHQLRREVDKLEEAVGKLTALPASRQASARGALSAKVVGARKALGELYETGLESGWTRVLSRRLVRLEGALRRAAVSAPPKRAPPKRAPSKRAQAAPKKAAPRKTAPKKTAPKKKPVKKKPAPKGSGRSTPSIAVKPKKKAPNSLSARWAERTLKQQQRELEARCRGDKALLKLLLAVESASGAAKVKATATFEAAVAEKAAADPALARSLRARDKAHEALADARGEPLPAPKTVKTADVPEPEEDSSAKREALEKKLLEAERALPPLQKRLKSFERALRQQQQSLESLYRADKALLKLWQAATSGGEAELAALEEAVEVTAGADKRLASALKSRNEYRDKRDDIAAQIATHEGTITEARAALEVL